MLKQNPMKIVANKMRFVIFTALIIILAINNVNAQTPTITSFTPASGSPGTLVTITGTDLNSPTSFTIGSLSGIVVSNSGTTLVGMVMPGSGTGIVSITTSAGTANSSTNFTETPTSFPGHQQGSKLVGTGSSSNAQQGLAVSVSADGNTAIVGGFADNAQGAAWIYVRSGNTWTQQGNKLVGTGNTGNARQGHAVALSADGNTAIIGGWGDASSKGAAWVFTRSGGTWTQQGAKLVGTSSTGAQQGWSVSLSADGNTAIVGGPNYSSWQGASWVYTRSGGVWTQQGAALVGTGIQNLGHQGNAVSLSADGNTALVGGDYDNYGIGATWIFTRSGSTWTQQGSKLVGTNSSSDAQQGYAASLSADGNTAIIGGFVDNSNQGAAWIFTRSGSTWTQQGSKLVGTGNIGAAKQGNSVSLSADGNIAIVGGPADNSSVGATWIYSRSGSTWTQTSKQVGTGNSGSSGQGVSVAMSADGSTALVGGNWDNSYQGAAWVFVPGPPIITSETAVTAIFGSANTYNITAYNLPTSFNATGLPTGMSLNTSTGVISIGSSIAIGNYAITISATNNYGTGSTTLNYKIANGWIGGTSNWNNITNWSSGAIPDGSSDILISTGIPTLDVNLTLQSGKELTINGTGTLIIAENKVLTIAGTADFGNKLVTIKSSATGTGAIGQISGSLNNATNIIVERYIANRATKGGWRFLSSPVQDQTIANWMTQFYVTGPGDGTILGDANSNEWHTNQANIDFPNSTFESDIRSVKTTSIRTYDESTSGNLDLGWSNLIGTYQSLTTGQGFRAYIRGPISGGTSQLGLNANSNVQGTVTLSLTGSINSGDIPMPISATATGAGSTFDAANDGWNLLGNPYPCAYDWNSGSTVKTNIATTIHVFDATANGYKSYNTSSGGTLTDGLIPSGAAFFVQATNTGAALTFKEAGKSTSAPIAVHKGAKTDEFIIKYSKDSTENDEFMVKMIDGSTLNKDGFDIGKLYNENLNLSSYGLDTLQLALSAIPLVVGETRIKLNVEATVIGTYKFEFKNINNFDADVRVSLLDKFTNKTIDVKANNIYNFEMGAAVNQWGKNRFELILNGKASGVDNDANSNVINSTSLSVYPNPAIDVLNININNANFKNSTVTIFNISGIEILSSNMVENNSQVKIDNLSSGVYFVKVTNENGFNKTAKFVK